MSGLTEWFRKMGHRLCKAQVPDKFLVPQLAGTLETADARLFKKLVQRGRLAPFYPGMDEPTSDANVTVILGQTYRRTERLGRGMPHLLHVLWCHE